MRLRIILPQLLASLACLLILGCQGDDGFEKRFPVSGTITYQEKPVAQGTVNFSPQTPGQGRACYGEIQDGTYSLMTHTPGDGAVPGKYNVTISATEIDMIDAMSKVKFKGSVPSVKDVMRVRKKEKLLIPKKYFAAKTSGLTAEVKAESNTINFDLVE